MRIIRNERRIRRLGFVGQYAALGGLLVLSAGLIISFVKPEWLTLMFVCVALGLVLSIVGGFFADRFAGPLARHTTLTKALKGLDDNYALLHYVLPAAHVLVEPGGCTVFAVKPHEGQVTYEDGRWKHRQRGKFFRQFAGQEAVGLPHAEAEAQVHKLERWLASQQPDAEVPVRAAIVFVNPQVKLDAADSPVPAFYGKKVKAWLRGPGKLKPLPGATQRWLAEATGVTPQQADDQ